MDWKIAEPPKDGNRYLFKFASDIICTGRYRFGSYGEPQQEMKTWRCDCCGRFATPQEWFKLEEIETMTNTLTTAVDLKATDKLARDHWAYIEDTLKLHDVSENDVAIAKYHYLTAFIHGYKHAVEDLTCRHWNEEH